jgi:hypothetical protein
MDITKRYDYKRIKNTNILPSLKPLFDKGILMIRPEDQKIVYSKPQLLWEVPWVYGVVSNTRLCSHDTRVKFEFLKILPHRCLSCWKIVVRPKTLLDLMKLMELQQTSWKGESKCGLEVRLWVDAPYGGYFYFDTMEEGLDAYPKIVDMVKEHLNPDTVVTLKRGCTELEHYFTDKHKKDTSQYEEMYDEDMEKRENMVDAIFDVPIIPVNQPWYVKMHVIQRWIEHAQKYSDPTASLFNMGEKLYKPCMTYHETLKDLKEV